MISTEQLFRLVTEATEAIDQRLAKGFGYADHSQLAELYYSRAELHLAAKNYPEAVQDFESCLDYDPYFREADIGREHAASLITSLPLRFAS